ncbi:MAG: DUF262 domain-containing HNH endonuclease family protein [Caldisericia bacterium]|nr:DUF262 domain-containing HNH endonuclease family protein [Caldisericia bacterium]
MIQSTNKYQISGIFDTEGKVKYVIPKFQREYTWKRENWENLFDDLMDNDKGYFLGTIIGVNKGVDALDITPLEIIDGQQRLITISLIYAAIYHKMFLETDEEIKKSEDFITEKNNLKYRLIQKGKKDQLKLELSYQNNNLEDYKYNLKEIGLYSDPILNKPLNLGNRRIYKAYLYFKDRISDFNYNELKEYLEKINSALLVKIEVNTHSDAFILFESLNNRGIPLSAIDLVKNNILSALEKKNIKTIDEAFKYWVKLIDNLPDYAIQERFLRQYYNAFRYKDKIKIQGIRKSTRSNLIKIYDQLIDRDVGFIFDELTKKSIIYNKFVDPKNNNEYYKGLIDLLHIGGVPSYTFLLYLFSEYQEKKELINKVVGFFVKYFVRRNLLDFPPTRDLDDIFIGLIEECEKNKNNLNIRTIMNFLTDPKRWKDVKDFEEKLRGNIYEDNVDITRFILTKIEDSHKTKEIFLDFWEKDKQGKLIWTIEHILPEGENIPYEWIDMIANGNINEAKRIQTEWVHKLGNLTLTGYNPNLGNYSFEKKKERKDKQGNNIGYKNGLYLNRNLVQKQSWTESDIKERTEELVNESLKLFKLDNE